MNHKRIRSIFSAIFAAVVLGLDAKAGTIYFGSYDGEPRSADQRVDAAMLSAKLSEGHMNFYNYLIYHRSTDWDDLKTFLDAVGNKNIKVIVDLVPPSEPPCSQPFCYQWDDWSRNIAQLSLSYPNLIGYTIDDFSLDFLEDRQSRAPAPEIVEMVRVGKQINPRLMFLPTVYGPHIADFSAAYKGIADGPLLYVEFYQDANAMPKVAYWEDKIATARANFKIVLAGIYAIGRGTPPSSDIPAAKVQLAHDLGVTGIVMYLLPWSGPTWDAVTGLYDRWNPVGPGRASVPAQ